MNSFPFNGQKKKIMYIQKPIPSKELLLSLPSLPPYHYNPENKCDCQICESLKKNICEEENKIFMLKQEKEKSRWKGEKNHKFPSQLWILI